LALDWSGGLRFNTQRKRRRRAHEIDRGIGVFILFPRVLSVELVEFFVKYGEQVDVRFACSRWLEGSFQGGMETIVGGYSCGPTVIGRGGRTMGPDRTHWTVTGSCPCILSSEHASLNNRRTQAPFTRLLQNFLTKYLHSAPELSRRLCDHQ